MKLTLLLKKHAFFSFVFIWFLLLSNKTTAQQSTITINGSATAGGTWSASAPWIFTASGATANIITTDITSKLATGNVTINASTGSGGAGTITLATALTGTIASSTQYTLTLSAPGAIALGVNKITLTGTAGNPGPNITITGASITSTATTPGITTSGLVGTTTFGKAGNITLTATSGNIAVVGLTAIGSAGGSTSPGTAGGNGGTIQVIATGTISTGVISCTGGAASSTGANNGGTGGSVTIQTTGTGSTITTGTITTTGGVNTSTGTAGNSGAINITSALSSITTGAITTTGANAPASISVGANAGSVTLIANTDVSTGIITAGGGTGGSGTTGGKGGNGGTIAITATTGTYTTSGAYTATGGNALGTGGNHNGGTGGNVTITANTTISTLAITTSGGAPKGTGTTGTSGAVAITSTTSSVSTGGAITTTGTAAGASATAGASAGNVTISSGTTLTIGTGGIAASGGSGGSTNPGGAGGNGGTVTLTAGSTLTCSTAAITTTGANANGTGNNNGGNGGAILLTTGTTGTISQNLSAAAGTKTGTGVAGTAGNYTFNTGGAVAFSGVANGGNLIKNGAGTLTVSGQNTFTGATTINAGTLKLGIAGTSPNGPLGTTGGATTVANGATLDTNGNSIATTESLTLNGTGEGNAGALINSSGTASTWQGTIALNTASTIGTTGTNSLVVSGIISGSNLLTINNSSTGNVTLSAANSITAGVTLNTGILKIGNATALGTAAGTFTINSGTTIDVTGAFTLSNNNPIVANGNFTFTGSNTLNLGTGSFTMNADVIITPAGSTLTIGGVIDDGASTYNFGTGTGAGTVVLNGTNTYGGTTTIGSTSTLKLGTGTNIPNSSAVTVTGTLELNGFSETVGSIAGAGTIDNNSGVATYTLTCGGNNTPTTYSGLIKNTSGTVAVIKTGTGTLTLSNAASTFKGALNINQGTVKLGANGTSPNGPLGVVTGATTVASDASLDLNGFSLGTVEPLSLAGTGTSNNGALTNSSATLATWQGPITLTNHAEIEATAGDITISGTITNATFTVTFDGTNNIIDSNNILGTGALVKNGAGNLTFSGTGKAYTGTTTLNAGTLIMGAATQFTGNTNFIFNGGNFSSGTGAGFAQATGLGTLTLNNDATISLGTGLHSIKFANSIGASWTSGKTLTVTNWTSTPGAAGTGGKLFSGNATTHLTDTQLAQITFIGYTGSAMMLALGGGEFIPRLIACTTPTVQPTSLVFTVVNGTALSGSFTAATTSPSPTKYLVLRSTSTTVPAPIDGNTYTAGGAGPSSSIVIQVSSATSFTDTGLSKNTTYYYYVYSFNDQCVGTTQYLTTSPLSGIAKTAANNVWYINNALETNDVYTTAAGSGSNNGLTPGTPYDNLSTLYSTLASANDIIYIDSGTYTTSQIRYIAFDKAITIIGAGPYLTIFDDATHVSYFGLITASNVKISNIKFYQYGNDSSSLRQGTTISVEAAASDLTGIEIKSCWFDNNPGSAQNGALSITTSSTGKITADILNTIFSCNNNGSYGGACTIEGNGHTIGFSKCFFYKNDRFAPGGGIYIQGTNSTSGTSTTVNVTNCTFNQNEGTRGGAIAVNVARLNVTNSCFTLNTNSDTSNKGNAISGSRYAIVSITNSKFTSNTGGKSQVSVDTATNTAGWAGPSTDLTITTSDFDASAANPQAIYFAGTTASVTQSTFSGSATTQIENASGTFTLSNSGGPTKTGTFGGNTSPRTAAETSAVCMMPVSGACGSVVVDCTTDDIFPPVIDETVSVITEDECTLIVPQYTATDVCDLTPTVTQTVAAGTILEPGTTTTVTITATDDAGNSSTATINLVAQGCPGICPTQTVWNGTSWSNNAPTTSVRAILTGNYNSDTNGNMDACNLYVFPGVTLTIPDNTYVNVVNSITNNGNPILIATKGNLIQVNSGATGNAISGGAVDISNITLTKTTPSKYRWDYVYWSMPFASSSSIISTNFSTAFDLKYYWDPAFSITIDRSYEGWRTLSGEPTLGTGFITRVKNIAPYNSERTAITIGPMTGLSTNGDYTTTVKYYDTINYAFRNFTLLGNPYPGALDFSLFYADNSSSIYGTAYLWTSYTVYTGTGEYQDNDYASFNLSGGVSVNIAVQSNSPNASIIPIPNGYIPSGQGFMVRPKGIDSEFSVKNVTFKNSHRAKSAIGEVNTNGQFFRINLNKATDRFWLHLTDETSRVKQQLIAYVDGATAGFDDAYDGLIKSASSLRFYSKIDTKKYSIQGKGTFDKNDKVAIGYSKATTAPEKLTISLAIKEGLFESRQPIYLYDIELDLYTDLTKRPYVFTTTANNENRFEIVYKLPDTEPVNAESNNVIVSIDNQLMTIAADTDIDKVILYDVTGKLVFEKTMDRKSNIVNAPVYISTGVYIAKVTLSNTKTHTLKLIKE